MECVIDILYEMKCLILLSRGVKCMTIFCRSELPNKDKESFTS